MENRLLQNEFRRLAGCSKVPQDFDGEHIRTLSHRAPDALPHGQVIGPLCPRYPLGQNAAVRNRIFGSENSRPVPQNHKRFPIEFGKLF